MSPAPARATLDDLLARGSITAEEHRQLCAALSPAAEADVRGSGAVAQGEGAQAAGERALVVGPGNLGPIAQDNRVQINFGPVGPDPAALRRAYLQRVWTEVDALPLMAGGDTRSPVRLGAVYTALVTETRDKPRTLTKDELLHAAMGGETPPRLSALALLDREPRLVLLGGPGSGKSVFVSFVAQAMAGELLGDEAEQPSPRLADLTAPLPADDAEDASDADNTAADNDEATSPDRQPWRHGALLPVRVILRDLAAQLPAEGGDVGARNVEQYLQRSLEVAALGHYTRALCDELLQKGGLVMFDGLDEVPEAQSRRERIQRIVIDFAATFSNCRILVTSRTYAYRHQQWTLPGFADATLAPFTPGQISAFVRAWYAHMVQLLRLTPLDAEGRAALLLRQVRHSPRIRELAERPLLLTLFARLQTENQGDLPQRREELYFDAVKLLLNDWERGKLRRTSDGGVAALEPSLSEWLNAGQDEIRRELNRLAFEAHRDQPNLEGTADIREEQLIVALLRASAGHADSNPVRLRDYLRDRAGILVEHGVGMLQFPHRTFQEYLAACWLANDDFPDQLARLARADPVRWREVTLLAAAHAARGNSDLPTWALVEALAEGEPPAPEASLAEADAWGALFAGQVLVASAEHEKPAPRNRTKLERARDWQLTLLTRGHAVLPIAECALAGRQLNALGDTRADVMTLDAMPFCLVPAGPFLMGEGETAYNQGPLHEVDLPYPYAIARWPVSTEQWREFVGASGRTPGNERSLHGPGNQPAILASWFDALEFCRLLEARWRAKLPPGWTVTLPSEAEWEKAARGGQQIPHRPIVARVDELAVRLGETHESTPNPWPDRAYPWGPEFGQMPANVSALVGEPSALGMGASAASPYGCEEMAGNVWEWTRSVWGTDRSGPQFRYPFDTRQKERESIDQGERRFVVVRGGSWIFSPDLARCAFRFRNLPGGRFGNLGFRVVLRSPPVA